MRIPSQEHYSTRCTMSHRPPFRTGEPIFFRCSHCGNVTVVCPAPKGTGEIPVLRCCDTELKPLQICRDPEAIRTHGLDFVVFGGFEHNAIRITVDGGLHPMDEGHRIEWIYLKTYQADSSSCSRPASERWSTFRWPTKTPMSIVTERSVEWDGSTASLRVNVG